MKSKKSHYTVVFMCSEKPGYPRNHQIIHALGQCCSVITLTSQKKNYPLRILDIFFRYLKIRTTAAYDMVYVGFLGQPLLFLIKLFERKPVILEVFISIFDTLCYDRQKFKPQSVISKCLFLFEWLVLRWAHYIVVDTNAHASYFAKLFNLSQGKFHIVYNSADETIFSPQREEKRGGKFIVLFHGTFWPLHGIEVILKAAQLLKGHTNMVIKLIGGGVQKPRMVAFSQALGLTNVLFEEWVSFSHLAKEIAHAQVCLGGHFSANPKAQRVISGKTFLYLAMKKAVIVGDNEATRELFSHRSQVYMCAMADAYSLAEAVKVLYQDDSLRKTLAEQGYKVFQEKCSYRVTARELNVLLNKIGNSKPRERTPSFYPVR